jgi:hypothetical protein
VSRRLETQFDFLVNYEVVQVDRIDRSDGRVALGFPDAIELDPRQELADRPILEVNPGRGRPWAGVFHGGDMGVPPAMPGRVIGWPDEWSICVIYRGGGVVVRTEDPKQNYEIAPYPITSAFVVAEREIVLFSDWLTVAAYSRDGLIWHTDRLALDDVAIADVRGDTIEAVGFFGGPLEPFTIDLATGTPNGGWADRGGPPHGA